MAEEPTLTVILITKLGMDYLILALGAIAINDS